MKFEIEGKGTITLGSEVEDALKEWYLNPEDDLFREDRTYVDANWFYERLKDNEQGIYQFCSQFNYTTDSEAIKAKIKEYEDKFDADLGEGGFDTAVYFLERYIQEACNEPRLCWW